MFIALIKKRTKIENPRSCECNSIVFRFKLLSAQEVLRGTFYMASLMAHSCVVNAQISIGNDSQMTVKATVPIQEGTNNESSSLL